MRAIPESVIETMAVYVRNVRNELGGSVVAVVLTGSATTDDYQEAGSDIDVLVLLDEPAEASDIERLQRIHDQTAASAPLGDLLEVEYIGLNQLAPIGVAGMTASVCPKGSVRYTKSRVAADDILGARSIGTSLVGPEPDELFPPVSEEVFVASQRSWLDDLLQRDQTRQRVTDEDYATWTLNIARCLFGIAHRRTCGKTEAANWLAKLDPDLAPTLGAALRIRRRDGAPLSQGQFQRFADRVRRAAFWRHS